MRRLATGLKAEVRVSPGTEAAGDVLMACGRRAADAMGRGETNVVLIHPATVDREWFSAWKDGLESLRVYVPGLDEDGRALQWESMLTTGRGAETTICHTNDGTGLDVSWRWDAVIAALGAGR